MDGDAPGAPELLPALGFFHLEFIEPYLTLFPSDHRFWRDLRTVWLETADVTVHDAQLVDVDREAFEQVSARKTGAAIIPVAAVLHYLGKAESRLLWDEFVQALGRWHQMHNDIFGWRKDLAHGAATFFLSEGRRRRPDGVEAWIVDGGFAWGMDELARSMAELKRLALSLDADEAVRYLDERDEAVRTRATEIERDLDLVLRLHGARSS